MESDKFNGFLIKINSILFMVNMVFVLFLFYLSKGFFVNQIVYEFVFLLSFSFLFLFLLGEGKYSIDKAFLKENKLIKENKTE